MELVPELQFSLCVSTVADGIFFDGSICLSRKKASFHDIFRHTRCRYSAIIAKTKILETEKEKN